MSLSSIFCPKILRRTILGPGKKATVKLGMDCFCSEKYSSTILAPGKKASVWTDVKIVAMCFPMIDDGKALEERITPTITQGASELLKLVERLWEIITSVL